MAYLVWQVFQRRSFFPFTIVSFDFALAVLPGWHTTIFPPYFVAGAIFSGFGMVLTLMLPLRALYGLHDLITQRHIDNMCKICLGTGSIVGYAYIMEFFIAWYGAIPQSFAFINRAFGQYWWAYVMMFSCNVLPRNLLVHGCVKMLPFGSCRFLLMSACGLNVCDYSHIVGQ